MERKRMLAACLCLAALLVGCSGDRNEEAAILDQAAKARIALGKSGNSQLRGTASCLALEHELKALAAAEILTWFEQGSMPVPFDGAPPAAGNGSDDAASEGPAEYTNNQVTGIDESDFVKTDGERLFVLQNNSLARFMIPTPGEIQAAGLQDIEGWPLALLMHDDRLLVVSAADAGFSAGGGATSDASYFQPQTVKLTLLEWPDEQAATILSERWFDGWFLTGRLHEANARFVLHGELPNPVLQNLWQYLDEHGDDAQEAALEDLAALGIDELLPRSYQRDGSGALAPVAYTDNDCDAIQVPADSNGGGVSSVVSIDLLSPDAIDTQHIVSNYPVVYMSAEHLYLAESAQDWWWFTWNDESEERLNLHAFKLDAGSIEYLDSVRTDGAPINQFALDEFDGNLRIATWTGGARWWWTDRDIESQLHTFAIDADGLQPLGSLIGIAPGEQMFAARFVDDTAYLVTFEQIDPLFVIDISDPSNPVITGELEVPGFSTYLHPIANNHLLAVGIGGDEDGVTWSTVVSLFDVNDPAAPALIAQHDFAHEDGDWNWSEALYEHKAFQFHADRGLLALPLGASREDNGIWSWTSTLELVEVDGQTLSSYGSIDHSTYFSSTDDGYYWSPDIRRSFFIGDYIYAISSKAVSVHPADNPATTVADALLNN